MDYIKPNKLVITTDDGSVGVHGMLPVALTEEAVRQGNYSAVYACGPTPMLAYVKQIAEETEYQQTLMAMKDNINSPEYIEQIAREKLDMYLPNERIYKVYN